MARLHIETIYGFYLPRPLQPGEFYCHKCDKFVPLEKHQEHNQEHARQQK